MRIAWLEGETGLVEVLEEYREHEATQLVFALANHDERLGERRSNRVSTGMEPDGG